MHGSGFGTIWSDVLLSNSIKLVDYHFDADLNFVEDNSSYLLSALIFNLHFNYYYS